MMLSVLAKVFYMRFLLLVVGLWAMAGMSAAGPAQRFNNLIDQTTIARGLAEVDACGGEAGKKEFVRCFAEGICPDSINTSLWFFNYDNDPWYRWYDELADIDPDNFVTGQAYLSALTAPLARDGRDPGFSYLTTQAADDAQGSSGAYVGFGFSFRFDAVGRFFFADVLQGGPAGDAGLQRGNEVLAIDTGNGFETISELGARQATYLELFGPSEAGVERSFRVLQGTVISETTIVKRELDTPPLAVEPLLIEREDRSPVGYLNLRSFILTANQALEDAILQFKDAGVTDLVIDFRYNGGGRLSVADTLLDLLGGLKAAGQQSWRLNHNDRRSNFNDGAVFAPLPNRIEPSKIAFITTGGTASASELVINSLEPLSGLEVVLVGEDTLGKAVGQYAFDQEYMCTAFEACDARLRLITFDFVNGRGEGEFYNGLASSPNSRERFTLCEAEDDLTRNFGDPTESSLAAALGWINSGACEVSSSSRETKRAMRGAGQKDRWHLRDLPDAPFGLSPWVQ